MKECIGNSSSPEESQCESKEFPSETLFYREYEEFYKMAAESDVFGQFCRKAFGADFSQDGFSDIGQVDRILKYIPDGGQAHILDIGCGNGKMLAYLQERTGAFIHGFDYSNRAVTFAKKRYPQKSDFRQGVMGEINYPEETFDLIVSMDTMYFAADMTAFTGQLWSWLKKGGTFFCAYQEGDVMPKTENVHTTKLAEALRAQGIAFETKDITKECYELLLRKREAAVSLKDSFFEAGEGAWYQMLIGQTEYAEKPFEAFRGEMARYLFVAKKAG